MKSTRDMENTSELEKLREGKTIKTERNLENYKVSENIPVNSDQQDDTKNINKSWTKQEKSFSSSPIKKARIYKLDDIIRSLYFLKDNYDLASLGSGSYATVFRIINKKNRDEVYALKIFPFNMTKSMVEAYENESTIDVTSLCDKQHSSIIKYYGAVDVQINDGIFPLTHRAILMEYFPGSNILDSLELYGNQGYNADESKQYETVLNYGLLALGPKENIDYNALLLMREILYAVDDLHQKNISHRDIKPDNILMITPTSLSTHIGGPIKIIDLGLSCRSDTRLNVKTNGCKGFKGSPLYVPSELMISSDILYTPEILQSGDIWGLGVTFHQILNNGVLPYEADKVQVLLKKLLNNERNPIKENPFTPRANSVVESMLVPEVIRPTAKDLIEDIDELLEQINNS